MKTGSRYFFDLPVYRLTEDRYNADRDRAVEDALFPPNAAHVEQLREHAKGNPRANDSIRDHLTHEYGGMWMYNEIVGYIRLYFLGTQVRGEYYAVRAKRIIRTRRKTFEYKTWKLAPEIEVPVASTSRQILAKVSEYIDACSAELRGRHIDVSSFNEVAPYINWRRLYTA